ncbi:hypothetical protein [Streptomyces sp. NBC_00094]|uniref:hypothetical protein n=1 Tax=Streptomyces sp. NBC_00094 TaxID=2903620 RepID=UPI002254D73F|nr:hypothetical protein [Streptomyces sp. NBC_00094]MCX5390857.1 hypothetical protein [Streptomyces sp. NBC_00094]
MPAPSTAAGQTSAAPAPAPAPGLGAPRGRRRAPAPSPTLLSPTVLVTPDRERGTGRGERTGEGTGGGAGGRSEAGDPAGDVVRWAVFCCALVPVVLVVYGTSLGGAAGTALGLVSVTAACRLLLRRSERGLRAETVRNSHRN